MKRILFLVAVVVLLAMPSCNTSTDKGEKATTEKEGEFTPSGDLQKDVKAIADMSIQSSQRMLNGEGNVLEDQAVADKMIQAANDYYTKQGRGEELSSN